MSFGMLIGTIDSYLFLFPERRKAIPLDICLSKRKGGQDKDEANDGE